VKLRESIVEKESIDGECLQAEVFLMRHAWNTQQPQRLSRDDPYRSSECDEVAKADETHYRE